MKSNKCIIPECFVDSCLIEVLLKADRKNLANHEKSNGRVASKMKSAAFANEFCLGIIDEDRKQLEYLKEFGTAKLETPSLRLWQHREKHFHYLIQIRPVIEDWILEACGLASINLSALNLPIDRRGLMRITKSIAARNDMRLVELFSEMLKADCAPVLQLKSWIIYLKEKPFNADFSELMEL